MALIDPCLYLQSDAHPARSFRAVITEMWDEGLMSLVDLRVTQKSGGANFSVDVSAGRAVVQGDSATLQGNYMVTNDATVNDSTTAVTSAPSAGNERYDIVILEIKDNAEDASGVNKPQFRVVAGTPASVGSGTIPSTPVSALRLAYIGPILNSTTTITDALIHQDNTLAGRRCTPGTVEMLAGSSVPNGWLTCDGTAVSRTTYARLFAHIGTSYGVGNGTTTFNLPDLRGKVAVPKKSGQSQVDTIGETGGEYTHTQTIAEMPLHDHNGLTGNEDATHVHNMSHDHPETQLQSDGVDQTRSGPTILQGTNSSPYYGLGPVGGDELTVDIPNFSGNTGTEGAVHKHAIAAQGSGTAFNVMQPYQVVGLAVIRT